MKLEKILLIFLALTPALPAQNTRGIDVLHYDIAITIDDSSAVIRGETRLQLRMTAPADSLVLDFAGLSVTEVRAAGTAAAFSHRADSLVIRPATQLTARDTLSLSIRYSGQPADGLIIRPNKHGRRSIFADNWPNRARFWFPGHDHPSDKATVTFRITAPQHFAVIANGRLQRIRNNLDGTRTTSYSTPVALPTYCMVFGAAEFDRIFIPGPVPISYWSFPEDSEDARREFRRAGEMLRYYTKRFGPYPFTKLALVQSSTRFGGMENAGAIFFAEQSIGAPGSIEETVAHEIAHQWFGDWLTPEDWQHLWLSEGFATYFGMQFFEFADGTQAFHDLLKNRRKRYLSARSLHEKPILARKPENLMHLLNANNYTKAGWVLHMLRSEMGDSAFWRGIKSYVAEFQGRNVSSADFQRTMQQYSPVPLGRFFQQWIAGAGIPELLISTRWQKKEKRLQIEVVQEQKTPLMQLPLQLAVHSEGRSTLHELQLTERITRSSLPLPKKPERIVADPNVRLLAAFRFEPDE